MATETVATNQSDNLMIQATNLTHFYGPQPAIEDVNFGVKKGEILGFLGPNGAGKTTTMRILTGFMPPTRGQVTLGGFDVVEKSLEVRRRVGYLPETVPLQTEMTVNSYLRYMGTLRGMPSRSINRRIDIQVLKAPVLDELINQKNVDRARNPSLAPIAPPNLNPVEGVKPKPLHF